MNPNYKSDHISITIPCICNSGLNWHIIVVLCLLNHHSLRIKFWRYEGRYFLNALYDPNLQIESTFFLHPVNMFWFFEYWHCWFVTGSSHCWNGSQIYHSHLSTDPQESLNLYHLSVSTSNIDHYLYASYHLGKMINVMHDNCMSIYRVIT